MRRPLWIRQNLGVLLLSILLSSSVSTTLAQSSTSSSQYRLNAGDLITIRVFDEDDLSMEARLTDAGTISYPFLGEVQVRGKTVGELEQFIISGLKGDYLINPRVNVTIAEYRKFFVRGEVNKPGGFSFEPGLTLEKAIALAGGFSQRANKKNVQVTRTDSEGKRQEWELTLEVSVFPGDIINVKESFF